MVTACLSHHPGNGETNAGGGGGEKTDHRETERYPGEERGEREGGERVYYK